MNDGAKTEAGLQNRHLVVTLLFLSLVIIGLAIPVFINFTRPVVTNEIVVYEEEPEIIVDNYVKDVAYVASNMELFEEGVSYYEAEIDKNLDDLDRLLALRIAFSIYLSSYEYMDESLIQLDLIDQSELTTKQLMKLFSAYRNYYIAAEEPTKVEKYNAKMIKLAEESGYNERI